jgi:hypothetical protein
MMNKLYVSILKSDDTNLKSYYKSIIQKIEFLSRYQGDSFKIMLLNLETNPTEI